MARLRPLVPTIRPDPPRRPVGADDVTSDIIGGSVTATNQGTSAEVLYIVENLSGTLIEAMAAAINHPQIPRRGDFSTILGAPVRQVHAVPIEKSPDKANVTVSYGLEVGGGGGFDNDPDDPTVLPTIETITTLQPVQTAFDVAGNVLKVELLVPPPEGEPGPPELREQGGTVEQVIVMDTIIARRRERLSPGLWKSRFNGRMNSSGTFGDPKHFWIVSIDGASDNNGASYFVTYTFQRNPETWNPVIVYKDPETGLVHVDVTPPDRPDINATGNGSKRVQTLFDVEFRDIGPVRRGQHIPKAFFS